MNKDDALLINAVFYDAPRLQTAAKEAEIGCATTSSEFESFLDQRRLKDIGKQVYQKRRERFDINRFNQRCKEQGVYSLALCDSAYPDQLRSCVNPPIVLYCKGDRSLLSRNRCLAVVGTRDMTAYGQEVTQLLISGLKGFFTIVSGMAAGVDSIAHKKTIDEGGQTIAVLGTSIDQCYPKSNQSLMDSVIKKGLVISEFPFDVKTQSFFFPMRNRIVSGLSEGVLVCEAGHKSGSLITARLAMEQGREVFCVPGSILIKQNKGNHALIQDGAKLVTSIEDVLVEFPNLLPEFSEGKTVEEPEQSFPPLSGDGEQLYRHILETEIELDQLIAKSGLSVQRTMQLLIQFELEGRVSKIGTCYRRVG